MPESVRLAVADPRALGDLIAVQIPQASEFVIATGGNSLTIRRHGNCACCCPQVILLLGLSVCGVPATDGAISTAAEQLRGAAGECRQSVDDSGVTCECEAETVGTTAQSIREREDYGCLSRPTLCRGCGQQQAAPNVLTAFRKAFQDTAGLHVDQQCVRCIS